MCTWKCGRIRSSTSVCSCFGASLSVRCHTPPKRCFVKPLTYIYRKLPCSKCRSADIMRSVIIYNFISVFMYGGTLSNSIFKVKSGKKHAHYSTPSTRLLCIGKRMHLGVLNNYNCIYCRIYSTPWAVRVAQPISVLHRKKANAYIYALSWMFRCIMQLPIYAFTRNDKHRTSDNTHNAHLQRLLASLCADSSSFRYLQLCIPGAGSFFLLYLSIPLLSTSKNGGVFVLLFADYI